VRRKVMAKRMCAKLKSIKETLLRHRHAPVPKQGQWLRAVVQGYFNYYAVPGTSRQLDTFRGLVNRFWLRALRRRSQKGRKLTWKRMKRLFATWIPHARIAHPYRCVPCYLDMSFSFFCRDMGIILQSSKDTLPGK
jgi:hypothetical protein